MATLYWGPSGGTSTGAWDATTTTNWFTDLARTTPASAAPTSADDVIFDGSSDNGAPFTVTLGTGAVCQDVTISGLDQTMTLTGSAAWNIYGSLAFPATNLTFTASGTITFKATTTGKTVTFNGKSLATNNQILSFDGVGGGWTLGSAISNTAGASTNTNIVQLVNGSLTTSNYSITTHRLTTAAGTTLTLGTSTVTALYSNAVLTTPTISLLGTISASSSTITCSGLSVYFIGNGNTFGTANFTSTAAGGAYRITGTNTFTTLSFTSKTATSITPITFEADQTVSGTLTFGAANTAIRRLYVKSNTVGTQRTLTVATLATLADVDFQDIKAAGASAASPWSGTRIGDCGGNNNITFATAGNKYWYSATGAGGNWSAAQWETTAGGTSPSVNNFPLPQDTVKFQDTGLSAGNTLTIDAAWNLPAIDGTSRTLAMTLASGTQTPTIFGDLTIVSAMTITGTGSWKFSKQGTQNVTTNGVSVTWPVNADTGTGTVKAIDNWTISNSLTLTSGTFDANGKNMSITTFVLGAGIKTLTMGAGIWTASGATWNANTNSSGLTVNRNTATITMTSASAKTFSGGGFSWPTLNQGGSGALTIAQSNTFANITDTVQPATITLTAGTTQTVEAFNIAGTAGNLITLNSSSAGSQATLSDASGTVSLSYVSIKDIAATGGAGWNAYTSNGNVDAGNNNGWVFDPAPADVSVEFFFNLRSFTEPRRF